MALVSDTRALAPNVAAAAYDVGHSSSTNNIDTFRIQFSELFKLHGERADGLRRDMLAYVRSIANVVKEGQKHGAFVDIPPTTAAQHR